MFNHHWVLTNYPKHFDVLWSKLELRRSISKEQTPTQTQIEKRVAVRARALRGITRSSGAALSANLGYNRSWDILWNRCTCCVMPIRIFLYNSNFYIVAELDHIFIIRSHVLIEITSGRELSCEFKVKLNFNLDFDFRSSLFKCGIWMHILINFETLYSKYNLIFKL